MMDEEYVTYDSYQNETIVLYIRRSLEAHLPETIWQTAAM